MEGHEASPIRSLARPWPREVAAEFAGGLYSCLLHSQSKSTALLLELWPIIRDTGCRT